MKYITLRPTAAALACLGALHAQADDQTLPAVTIQSEAMPAARAQPGHTVESVTARQAAETVNAVNTEDLLKYQPSILLRKRYIGDTQAPMATRTTGVNASARSLIYVDGILLSALINNNNQNGSPQWFMVAPGEVERIDTLYGPYSAAYPGNSFGAVTEISTRQPTGFEAAAGLTLSSQNFSLYGQSDRYPATQASVSLGDRSGDWSWRLAFNHLSSFSQPVTYLTSAQSAQAAGAATPIQGAIADRNRSGAPIQIVGAGNLTHTVQDSATLKLGYDLPAGMRAAYTLGYWQNSAQAGASSFLRDAGGQPYYGAASGTVALNGNGYGAAGLRSLYSANTTEQAHWMHGLSLRSARDQAFTWEAQASNFSYGKDLVRTSTGAYGRSDAAGRITDAAGTGWSTLDLSGGWRQADGARHRLTVGAHLDRYRLESPSYATTQWETGAAGALTGDARGSTRTEALWAQDVWQVAPSLTASVGGRYERWHAYDGFNLSSNASGALFPINQPEVRRSGFSPKFSLSWQAAPLWSATASLARALRFPTVGELYQSVQTGTAFIQANPFLKPEDVRSAELALERSDADGRLRLSLFGELVDDALVAQTSTIAGIATPLSFVQNLDRTRQRGIELVAERRNAWARGLDLSASMTYVDAKIVANSGYAPTAAGATSVGKRTPYVPAWRATAVATWRPDEQWSHTLAARYSSRVYATVDNSDINPGTYQGFQSYLVLDARVQYKHDRHWTVAAGIDNINNRKYFLFHPFPQRTVFAELRYRY
ncbi:TonB-dependent receptor [Noviherbaspirillum sp. 1P10PC]|uniref:TonB-dependent receptor n=1 Tax=Noviherbaspirillum sp. 1P10PC TaxID=3132292 RepID=UPI0039A0EBF9